MSFRNFSHSASESFFGVDDDFRAFLDAFADAVLVRALVDEEDAEAFLRDEV